MTTGLGLSSSQKTGKLIVAFSDESGSSIGVEFASTTQKSATAVMGICASTFGDSTGKLVTSNSSGDTSLTILGGGDNMEKRLAVLETEVAHIKSDVSELKADVKKITSDVADIQRDMAVVLQKVVDIDKGLSEKPSTSEMTAAIASATNKQIVWTIGIAIAILGLAKYIF